MLHRSAAQTISPPPGDDENGSLNKDLMQVPPKLKYFYRQVLKYALKMSESL